MSRAVVYRAPGETERCPACASRRLYELDVLPLRRPGHGRCIGFVSGCEDCGLAFSNPVPSVDELKLFYSPTGEWRSSRRLPADCAGEARDEPRGRSWAKLFDPIRRELRVTAPPTGARVLDFGCGTGTLLDAFQAAGWETWGIEPALDDAFRRHARLHTIPREAMFDLIVANHVLEHVVNPLDLLEQFGCACRMGGYLFISVPRLDTLPIHRDFKYIVNGRAHVTAYTWPCLQGLLARAGWAPVAPPPDRVPKGRGRTTCSRLRVVARRVVEAPAPPPSPAEAARTAVRQYQAGVEGRTAFERLGFYRLAARRERSRHRHAREMRKSAKIGATPFVT